MRRRTSRDEARSQAGEGKMGAFLFFVFFSPHREREGSSSRITGRTNKAPSRILPPASQGDCATINHRDLNGEQSAEEGDGSGAGLREL